MSTAISVILALAYMAVVVMTMQELSLPQRLWIHRSIFGQHNLNYYNSEPFGGDTPTSASAEEWKDYQRRALNEEAQALAMLVSGITLEISTKRINEGATALVPKLDSTEENSTVIINISIPEKINGRVNIVINKLSTDSIIQDEPQEFIFYKENDIFYSYDSNGKRIAEINTKKRANMCSKYISLDIQRNTKWLVKLSVFSEENDYSSIASDKVIIHA